VDTQLIAGGLRAPHTRVMPGPPTPAESEEPSCEVGSYTTGRDAAWLPVDPRSAQPGRVGWPRGDGPRDSRGSAFSHTCRPARHDQVIAGGPVRVWSGYFWRTIMVHVSG
jgi:hypothetical protein